MEGVGIMPIINNSFRAEAVRGEFVDVTWNQTRDYFYSVSLQKSAAVLYMANVWKKKERKNQIALV